MQPYPRSPDLLWPAHLHGTGRLSARAMDTGLPIVVWHLCLGLGRAWVWVSVTPPALAGVLGGCVWVRVVVLPLYSRLGSVVFAVGLGFRPAPHHSWLGFWGVCGCVRAPPVTRRSHFGCAVWACVLGFGLLLRPATPRGGVGVCVCLCARPAWSPAPPGWGCGAGLCAWAWVAAAPRHSWLGCWGVGVFVCAPRLFPAIAGWGVRCGRARWAPVSAVPRPFWLRCLGVCAFVRVPRLHPAILGGPPVAGSVQMLPGVGFTPPPFLLILFFGGGGVECRVVAFGCRSLAVPFLPLVVCVPPSPPFRAATLCVFLFPSSPQRGVCLLVRCVHSSAGPLPPVWCYRPWLGGPPVTLGGVPSSLPSGWGVWLPLVVWSGDFVAGGLSRAPPLFSFWGGVCRFLPLPSVGWCTHWSAFGVVIRDAVGACVLPGLAPAPWVGWVMYTFGSVALSVGLGSGSAGWAVAPGGFVRPWVRLDRAGVGLGFFRIFLEFFWNFLAGFLAWGGGWLGWGCPCPFASAVPVLTFWRQFVWTDRHCCCRARNGPLPVCGGLVRRPAGSAGACFG